MPKLAIRRQRCTTHELLYVFLKMDKIEKKDLIEYNKVLKDIPGWEYKRYRDKTYGQVFGIHRIDIKCPFDEVNEETEPF